LREEPRPGASPAGRGAHERAGAVEAEGGKGSGAAAGGQRPLDSPGGARGVEEGAEETEVG
jgi:hypothetical protein